MTKKIQLIINQLKANQSELYSDSAFQYFIDNQINVDELAEILKEENISLPDEFYKLSKPEQKSIVDISKFLLFIIAKLNNQKRM